MPAPRPHALAKPAPVPVNLIAAGDVIVAS